MTLLPLACSLPHSLERNDVGAEGAKALGKALETNCTLRELNLRGNSLDSSAKQMLKSAWKHGAGNLHL